MVGVTFDRRRPDLVMAVSVLLGICQAFAIGRERIRGLQGLAVCQPLRLAHTVSTDPIKAWSSRAPRFEDDALAIVGPHRGTVHTRQGSETRRGVTLDVLYPDVSKASEGFGSHKRQAPAVGREARIPVVCRGRMQRLRLAGAVQPKDRVLTPLAAQVDERSGLGKVEISAAQYGADVFEHGLRNSRLSQSAEVEGRSKQRVLAQVD